jgi:hypothetical protein
MSLHEVWQAAAGSPFEPAVSKDNQLYVGFALLLIGSAPCSPYAIPSNSVQAYCSLVSLDSTGHCLPLLSTGSLLR